MAPHIQLGPDGPERLWQRHYKHTHKEIAAATSSALYIKAITVDEERGAALPVNDRATIADRQVHRVSTTTWGSTWRRTKQLLLWANRGWTGISFKLTG